MSPIIVPRVIVNEKQANQFIESVCHAINKLDKDYFNNVYIFKRDSLAISFDLEFEPFIGFTPGYNYPKSRQVYIKETYVLQNAVELLSRWNFDIHGGRLFINNECIFRHMDNQNKVLCFFDWYGEDPVEEIRRFYNKEYVKRNKSTSKILEEILELLKSHKQ